VAVQARNAFFGPIVVNPELLFAVLSLHGTNVVARPAIYAIGVSLGEDGGKSVENGQASAQGANHFAKEAPMPHCQYNDPEQYGQTH